MITATQTKQDSFFADILAAIDYGRIEPEVVSEWQTETITEILNPMIELGASFDVSADDFQVINADILRRSDRDFLHVNSRDVLCTVQQSLLTKHLFSHSKHLLSDFAMEIAERESISTQDGKLSIEAHFEAVREITKKWFKDLLATEN